jgi:hypothetical protein
VAHPRRPGGRLCSEAHRSGGRGWRWTGSCFLFGSRVPSVKFWGLVVFPYFLGASL